MFVMGMTPAKCKLRKSAVARPAFHGSLATTRKRHAIATA